MINWKWLFIICFIVLPTVLRAEIFKPLQIFFPGNFKGKLVELDQNLKLSPSLAWSIPSVISYFSNEDCDSVSYACGDISSIYEPVSFLFEGKIERDLTNKCEPAAFSVSPMDMAVLNATKPDRRIGNCIFSNAEGVDVPSPFLISKSARIGEKNIIFFNFISPSRCDKLHLNKWTNVVVNNFSRAFRMISLTANKNDITVTTVYGSKAEVEELISLFSCKEGTHFLIQMPLEGEEADYPFTEPFKKGNVFVFSLENGNEKLPMLKLNFKNHGVPRASLRMLPLDKCPPGNSKELYEQAEKRIRKEIFKPLRVISTAEKASTSANIISNEAYGSMLKNAIKCDAAIALGMAQGHFSENVIYVGNIATVLKNDRIYRLRLSGKELRKAILSLLNEYGSKELFFGGCSFKYFCGEINDLKIGGIPINEKSSYIVAVPEGTIKKSDTLSDVYNRFCPCFEGVYLWNLWKNWLKTSKLPNEKIFD